MMRGLSFPRFPETQETIRLSHVSAVSAVSGMIPQNVSGVFPPYKGKPREPRLEVTPLLGNETAYQGSTLSCFQWGDYQLIEPTGPQWPETFTHVKTPH